MTQIAEVPVSVAPNLSEASQRLRHQSQKFIGAIKSAFNVDIATHTPSLIPNWNDKTIEMIDSGYDNLSPLAKRSVHVLTTLGEAFPNCATLETMTRSVIRTNEFKPEQISKILNKFQVRARAAGNPAILSSSALLAINPLFTDGKLSIDEKDLLRIGIALLPPILAETSDNINVVQPDASKHSGETKSNLDSLLASKGLSNEAISAFKQGKGIYSNFTETGFGTSSEDNWEDKDE